MKHLCKVEVVFFLFPIESLIILEISVCNKSGLMFLKDLDMLSLHRKLGIVSDLSCAVILYQY